MEAAIAAEQEEKEKRMAEEEARVARREDRRRRDQEEGWERGRVCVGGQPNPILNDRLNLESFNYYCLSSTQAVCENLQWVLNSILD